MVNLRSSLTRQQRTEALLKKTNKRKKQRNISALVFPENWSILKINIPTKVRGRAGKLLIWAPRMWSTHTSVQSDGERRVVSRGGKGFYCPSWLQQPPMTESFLGFTNFFKSQWSRMRAEQHKVTECCIIRNPASGRRRPHEIFMFFKWFCRQAECTLSQLKVK